MLLSCEELCVCELSGILNVSQPNISKHLSKLRDVGFVRDERKEKFIFYKLEFENKVLIDIVKNISDKLSDYQQLAVDKERIVDKEIYFNQCKCNLVE
jgi:ArsR family transcriptional regulator